MSIILSLTAEEQSLSEKYCASIIARSGAEIVPETLTNFETPDQSRLRWKMCRMRSSPRLQLILDQVNIQVKERGDIGSVDFSTLTKEELHQMFSMLGATGVSAFIELGILHCLSEEDLRAVASLTHVRHGLLQSNREFFTVKQ